MRCEGCEKPAEAVLSYLRTTKRAGQERVSRHLCMEHGRQVWGALAAPLRDTAIIEPAAKPTGY